MASPRKLRVIVIHPWLWPLLALPALLIIATAVPTLSPSAVPISLYYGSPLKGITIAIDPGHGGMDSGAHFESLVLEKEIVLEIGLSLRRLLEQAGARAVLTREKDEDLGRYFPNETLPLHRRDIRGRVNLINASGANIALSLHINSIYDSSVRGPITFYVGEDGESKRLAEALQKNLNSIFSNEVKPGQLMHQHPQESNAYYILNETDMPTALLEIGFMSSPDDRKLLTEKQFQKKIARSIFLGVVEYIYSQPEEESLIPEIDDNS